MNHLVTSTACLAVLDDETLANALLDYRDVAERPLSSKQRCRDCGQLFDTIEAHKRHYHEVHHQIAKYPLEELLM